jgi:chromosome segregation ATPase
MPKFGGFLKRKKNTNTKRESTVKFDEGSNEVNDLPPLSPSQKPKLWVSKADLQQTRQEAQREAVMEKAEEKVREAVVKDLGNFVTKKKRDKKVNEILQGGPDTIRAYLEEHGVSIDPQQKQKDNDGNDEKKKKAIGKSIKNKLSEDIEERVDHSPPKRPVRGLSRQKSVAVLTLEAAMKDVVDPILKKQIVDAIYDKDKGIDSLEEALEVANDQYVTLKDKQRKFISIQEELEALARRQMRQIEKMQRQLQKPKTSEPSLDSEVEEIDALREALDQANNKTTTLKSKDRKLVAVSEELETLCRRQQAQIERAEKDHFDRLKAKDILNEALKGQLSDAKKTFQEKDQIIAMLQEQRRDDQDNDSQSADGQQREDIQDELVANLESKDALIESLRNQFKETKQISREKDEEIKALERKLKEARQRDGPSQEEDGPFAGSEQSTTQQQQQVEQLQKKIQSLKEREEKNDDLMEKMEAQLDDSDEAFQRAESDLENKQAELDDANDRVEELEKQLRNASPNSSQSQQGQQQQQQQVVQQQQESSQQLASQPRDDDHDSSGDLDEAESRIREMERKLKRAESQQEKAEEGLDKANKQIKDLKRKLAEKQEDSQDQNGGQSQQQVSQQQSQSISKSEQQQVQSISRSEQDTQIQQRNVSDGKELAKLQKKLDKANERIDALRAKLNLANATIKDLQREGKTQQQDQSQSRSATSHYDQEVLKQKEGEVDAIERKLNAADKTISDLQRQLKEKAANPSSKEDDEEHDSLTSLEKEIRMKEKDQMIMALEQEIEQLTSGQDKADSDTDEEADGPHGQKSLIDQLEEKDMRIASLEADLAHANRLVERFEDVRGVPDGYEMANKLEEKESEVENLRQQLEGLEAQSPDLDRKSIMIRQEKTDALLEKVEEQLKEAEESLEAKDQELDELKAKLHRTGPESPDEKDDEIAKLQIQLSGLERDLRSTVKDRDRKWVEKDAQIEALEQALAQAKKQTDSSLGGKDVMVTDLQGKLDEELELVQKLLGQLETSEAASDEKQRTIESQGEKGKENEKLIGSLEREIEKQKKASDVVSLGTDSEVLNFAAVRADLEVTEQELREAQEKLDDKIAANRAAELKILTLENDLEDKDEQIALKERQIELSSLLQDQIKNLKRSLDSNRQTIDTQANALEDKVNQIRSLKKSAGDREMSGVITKGSLSQVLEAANLNAKLDDMHGQLKKEQSAHKKAKSKIQKLESETTSSPSDGESKSDIMQQLNHQSKMTKSLRDQLATAKSSIDSKGLIIESLSEELADKDSLIRTLEMKLEILQRAERSLAVPPDEYSAGQADLLRRLRKEQSAKEKATRKCRKLQNELDGQLGDWALLEREMDEAKARVDELQSHLANEMSQRSRSIHSTRGDTRNYNNRENDDFHLYLDGLKRKVRDARSQLEAAHTRLDRTLGRYRVTPVQQSQ